MKLSNLLLCSASFWEVGRMEETKSSVTIYTSDKNSLHLYFLELAILMLLLMERNDFVKLSERVGTTTLSFVACHYYVCILVSVWSIDHVSLR